MFLLIFFSLPVLTCIWWALALKLLRGRPRWQLLVSVFGVLMLFYIVLTIAMRRFGFILTLPKIVDLWAYCWYLFTVPIVVLPCILLGSVLLYHRWK
ncbi:MAG: hypothetical protein ABI579_08210, partial [Candidatus Sumerlaeota bacterium]